MVPKLRCGLVALLIAGLVTGCADCTNTVSATVPSPGVSRVAVIFGRDCGATTGFSTQVSILPPSDSPPEGGNVLVIDDSTGTLPALRTGGPRVEARWLARDHLELRYSQRARVFTAGAAFEGIRVTHVRDST